MAIKITWLMTIGDVPKRKYQVHLRASLFKPLGAVLNQYPSIRLIFTCMIQTTLWWFLVQIDSKNIEPSILYRSSTKRSIKPSIFRSDFGNSTSHERLYWLSWNILWIYKSINSTVKRNITLIGWILGILWISVMDANITILAKFHESYLLTGKQ